MSHHRTDWERRLTAAGHRVTRQRTVVLDAVCAAGGHTTADDVTWRVAAADPGIDRTTVARTLAVLADVGIISASATADGATVYEVVGHAPHHHLVCRRCGHEEAVEPEVLAPLARTLADHYGFALEAAHAMLPGTCARCRETPDAAG